jgi:hypothetical protein
MKPLLGRLAVPSDGKILYVPEMTVMNPFGFHDQPDRSIKFLERFETLSRDGTNRSRSLTRVAFAKKDTSRFVPVH